MIRTIIRSGVSAWRQKSGGGSRSIIRSGMSAWHKSEGSHSIIRSGMSTLVRHLSGGGSRSIVRSGGGTSSMAYQKSELGRYSSRLITRRFITNGRHDLTKTEANPSPRSMHKEGDLAESLTKFNPTQISQIRTAAQEGSSAATNKLLVTWCLILLPSLGYIYAQEYKEHLDKLRMPTQPPLSHAHMKKLAKREEYRLEMTMKKKGIDDVYPYYHVTDEERKINIRFTVPPICYIPDLIEFLVSDLGLKVEDVRGSDIKRRTPFIYSDVDWRLKQEAGGEEDLTILISHHDTQPSQIEFLKGGTFTDKELQVFASVLKLAGESTGNKKAETRSL